MNWNVVMENLGFVVGCIAVVGALGFGAKLVEKALPETRKETPDAQ